MSGEVENTKTEEEEIIAVEDDDLKTRGSESESLEEEPEEEEHEESRLGESEDDAGEEDREVIRQRRREERKEAKKRRKESRDRNFRELDFLRKRNEQLERRFSEVESRVDGTELSSIRGRIEQVKSQLALADDVMAKAVEAQSGEDLVEAQNIRDGLRDSLRDLQYAEQTYQQQREAPESEEEEAPQVDPRIAEYANEFMDNHKWWKPNGIDQDSLIVSAIDTGLIGEGFDPTTQDYWDELEDRVKDQLPHRFNKKKGNGRDEDNSDDDRPSSEGGPTFRSGGRERRLKKNEVYISPERKTAMEEAGVWDDPVLRQRYLKSFEKYDREAVDQR